MPNVLTLEIRSSQLEDDREREAFARYFESSFEEAIHLSFKFQRFECVDKI